MHRQLIVGILVLCCARLAVAIDQPISGAKLTLRRSSSGKEKLVFVSKDPLFLFPAIGSADDPGTGTPGGATLELESTGESTQVVVEAPPVVGKPGWTAKDGNIPSHTFKNPTAAPGPSMIKVIVLKEGKRIKVTARGVGVPFLAAQGAIGVRIRTGSLRNCAFFGAGSVRRDDPGRFVATNAPAVGVDCNGIIPNTTTSFGTTTTTTSSSTGPITSTTSTTLVLDACSAGGAFPTCDGACGGSDTCQPTIAFVGVPDVFSCLCYPPGVTACATSLYPSCGGSCPTGGACQALHSFSDGETVCGCVDQTIPCGGPPCSHIGVCPAGQACTVPGVGVCVGCTTS